MEIQFKKRKFFTLFLTIAASFSLLLTSCNKREEPSESLSEESETTESIESIESIESEETNSEESVEDESTSIEESIPESEETSESIEEGEESEVTHITLDTPVLSLDNETGLVTWNNIDNAEYYRYYINAGEVKSITANSMQLESGQTISVIAESTLENVSSSSWSKPITYFDTSVDVENVTIAFAHTNLSSVEIQKGSTYTLPTPNQKENHTFEGWYLDPYFTEKVLDTHVYSKDTVVYADYIAYDWVLGASFWIKASPLISSTVMSNRDGWQFIPLEIDESETSQKNGKLCFSAVVVVEGATSTSPAAFIVMDGTSDDESRTYYKNGESDFTIQSDGTYRIYFSVEHAWENNGQKRNCHIEQISESVTNTYTSYNLPLGVLSSSEELYSVNLHFDEDGETVRWNPINHATSYEYIIDNGQIMTTTTNSVILYEGSFITVRAITDQSGYLSSKWSAPLYHEIPTYPDSVYVYYYGLDRGSEVVKYGEKAAKPTNNPVKPGYNFINWYKDISLKTVFDFEEPLYKNTVIYAGFEYVDTALFSLYKENQTTKIGDLEVSIQYSYNEYKINYTTTTLNEKVYVKDNQTNDFYGPYQMGAIGTYNLYFSLDNLWDIGSESERNAYWQMETNKIYFTNGNTWSNVYIYTWNDSGYYVSWPGEKMTFVETNSYGQDIYEYTLPSGYTNIVFSNGKDGNSLRQTVDIDIAEHDGNNAFYPTSQGSDGKYGVESWYKED